MGAEPGPACYGRGGDRPTLTDVNLVLGYLDPEHFAGGQVAITVERAEQVLRDQVAKPLGTPLAEASLGVYGVANHQMAEAIRYVSVERGYDPHDFTLVAFGGSGPIHAAAVARELGILRVQVPRHPGLYSAHGIAMSDFTHDYMLSLLKPVDGMSMGDVAGILEGLQAQATRDLDTEDIPAERRRFIAGLDMRYVGQTTEINVPMADGWQAGTGSLEEMVQAFHERHERLYTYAVPGEPVEVVNVRLKAIGQVDKPDLPAGQGAKGTPAALGKRPVWFVGRAGALDTPVYLREALLPGMTVSGPAIVQELSSTTVIPPDTRVEVDPYHNLILNLES
jgi:N-methylhydantoinase A